MIKTVLFDVDGTLLDTEYAVIQSFRDTLAIDPAILDEELHFILGIPGVKALERYAGSTEEIQNLLELWVKNLNSHMKNVQLFPNVLPVLQNLQDRNYQLGIVTSKLRPDMESTLDSFNLRDYFTKVVTASDTEKHKPHPEPILRAMELLNSSPEETIYIGDSIYDLQSAHSSQVSFALAGWGAKVHEEFAQVHQLVTPEDLINYLEG
ncbi:HAD family hydrolase [Enterococcus sp. AZ072]|uniref:HAD family hydrolase n=1 Tax=unclassified Enterococcus TaxID=2608891 RepID=UPI003D283EAF